MSHTFSLASQPRHQHGEDYCVLHSSSVPVYAVGGRLCTATGPTEVAEISRKGTVVLHFCEHFSEPNLPLMFPSLFVSEA